MTNTVRYTIARRALWLICTLLVLTTQGLVRDYNKAAVALMDAGASSEAKEQLDRALTLAGERGPLAGRADLQRRMQVRDLVHLLSRHNPTSQQQALACVLCAARRP